MIMIGKRCDDNDDDFVFKHCKKPNDEKDVCKDIKSDNAPDNDKHNDNWLKC